MRLRNIFKFGEEVTHDEMNRFMEFVNKGGDTVAMHTKMEHEKIPLDIRDLVMENMNIIKILLEKEK